MTLIPEPPSVKLLLFFNPREAADIGALVDEIIPAEPDSPGAVQAGVVQYIDQGLAGFMRDLQPTYRSGMLAVAEMSDAAGARHLADLDQPARQRVVAELDALGHERPGEFVGQFFRIVREHTIQGFFGDPAYGGNRELAGWRLVGFPGAQWEYTPAQMRPGTDATSIPIFTIEDLYRRHRGNR